jgi:ubiquinone/menaquinone biosynthesis C-methylase UbiE
VSEKAEAARRRRIDRAAGETVMGDDGPARWFFDAWSQVYDLPPVQWATYRPVHDAVLQALHESTCRRVLDVGCGTGQLAGRVTQACPDAQVVGCDFSAGMLRRAAMRCADVGWVRGDAMRLPFPDGAFDAVISTEAFHWFARQDAALAEFFRVLAPGGRLLLALVNTPGRLVSEVFHVGSRLVGQPFYWPTMGEIRQRVTAAGFRVEAQRRVFRLPGFLLPPVLTRAVRPIRPHGARHRGAGR